MDGILQRAAFPSGARLPSADGALARASRENNTCGHDGQRFALPTCPPEQQTQPWLRDRRKMARPDFQLRNRFKKGGCAGMTYTWISPMKSGDEVIENQGVKILI
jgi:hypothetical protein